jgi:hypothetical protein
MKAEIYGLETRAQIRVVTAFGGRIVERKSEKAASEIS